MSSTFQAVVRGPSFTGLGNRPTLTPAHQVERPTGIGPCGARIDLSRTKPALGRLSSIFSLSLQFAFFIVTRPFERRRRRRQIQLNLSPPMLGSAPLVGERGINPAKSRVAARRAALFSPCDGIQVFHSRPMRLPRRELLSKGGSTAFPPLFFTGTRKFAGTGRSLLLPGCWAIYPQVVHRMEFAFRSSSRAGF